MVQNKYVKNAVDALVSKKWKIAFAESASAGKLSYAFSTVKNAGEILLGGIVCYDSCIKEKLLKVPKHLIDRFSAESEEVTRGMAFGLKELTSAEVNVALTGLTAPGGSESLEKPVGTIFIHILFPTKEQKLKAQFPGSPTEILDQAINAVAKLITFEAQN